MKFSDFGFKENPFSITPDPRYLFLSRGHEESLAHLIYGTGPNGGFVLLTGEVGTGKTMLVRSLLAQKLDHVEIALILNPRLSRLDFIAAICDELRIGYPESPLSLKQLNDILTRHLLRTHAQGRHTVLVVDEAQNLSPEVLEQVRLLTNLETARHKLLRIILVGQPELRELLARTDLRQVDQRITARYHLYPLSRTETARYIQHRLAVAGIQEELFSPAAQRLIHRLTQGVPRKINTLCERALLAIFATGVRQVGMRLVWRAWREIKGHHRVHGERRWLLAGILIAMVVAGGWWFMPEKMQQPAAEPATQSNSAVAEPEIPPPPDDILLAPTVKPEPMLQELDEGAAGEQADEVTETAVPELPSPEPLSSQTTVQEPEQPTPTVHQRLFALWGKSVDPGVEKDFCNVARYQNLRCLRAVTDWAGLKRLNRPALLKLNQNAPQSYMLLKKWTGDRLLVDDGIEERFVSQDALTPSWQGEFVLLWRPLTEVPLVGVGSSGEAVTWLRERLSLADGWPVPVIVGLDHFDDELKARVEQFQKANGLMADGIAGARTMIYLNNLQLPAATPTLGEKE